MSHINNGDNMKKQSIWLKDFKNSITILDKDIDCDILIIGAGITGLSTAYHLINSNLKVVVVDKDEIGNDVTARTTGKITYLQELIYTRLKKELSEEMSKNYLESQLEAIDILTNIIEKEKIECDLEQVKSFVFTKDKKELKKLKEEKELLEKFGIDVLDYNNAIEVNNTYFFHPIKYLMKLKEIVLNNNIEIYEKTNIIEIKKEDECICLTENNKIKAKKVVLACHYPFFLFPLLFPIKGHLEKSYVGAIKNKNRKISMINTKIPTTSLRYHHDYMIYLNNSHPISTDNNDKDNFDSLINITKKLGNIDYIWSNHDIITVDHLPIISKITDDLLIGTGYNTWGMTNGTLAGKILSDIILNRKNKFIDLFSLKRHKSLNTFANVLVEILRNGKSFTMNKIVKNKNWYSSNLEFKKIAGEDIAIYTDDNNEKHTVYNKCPHLGCSLIFNEFEKTWDCPCHGSKFDIDGNCLRGPSKYNISYKK